MVYRRMFLLRFKALLLVWAIVLSVVQSAALAASYYETGAPIILSPGQSIGPIAEGPVYRADNRGDLPPEDVYILFETGAFGTYEDVQTEFAGTDTVVWAAMMFEGSPELANVEPAQRRFVVQLSNYRPQFLVEVYVVRDGQAPEKISGFGADSQGRFLDHHGSSLVSQPFEIAAGERVALMTRQIWQPKLPANLVTIDPAEGYFIKQTFETASTVLTFAVLMLSSVAVILFWPLARNTIGSLLAIWHILLTVHVYIVPLYVMFWGPRTVPEWQWNVTAGLQIACGFWIALYAFRDRIGPMWRWAMVLVPVISTSLIWPYGDAVDLQMAQGLALWVTYILVLLVAALRIEGGRKIRWAVAITLGAVGFFGFMVDMLGPYFDIPMVLALLFNRHATAFAGVILMGAAIWGAIEKRRARDRLEEQYVAALSKSEAQARRLLNTERSLADAREAARTVTARMAAARHDMRQPLVGLRMTLGAFEDDLPADMKRRMGEAVSYMDGLINSLSETEPVAQEQECFPLNVVLCALHDMFAEEADALGVELSIVASTVETDLPALPLMRAVSNLVSNALRHAQPGRVLVGVRRGTGGAWRLEVHDNGRGMDDVERTLVLQEGGRGDSPSDGEGRGLSIVQDIAARCGFDFQFETQKDRGTIARLGMVSARHRRAAE